MTAALGEPGVRTFFLVLAGQLVSLVGSGLTAFSLGVWIYQQTQSTTQFALVTFCAAVPPLVVLPLAGSLIDRWGRKPLLIACEIAGAGAAAAVGLLAWLGALSLVNACIIVAVTASAGALQWPAWAATVTLLVPRTQLGRASGLAQIAAATSQVIAPVLAGGLISIIGLVGITAIDLTTFLFAIATLLVAAIPSIAPESVRERRSYWRDMMLGWDYIFRRAGLAALLSMFVAVNFFSEIASVLFTPLVLNLSTPAALGSILAVGGLGMIAGGALLSVWGGPRRSALGAVAFAALTGVAIAAAGMTVSVTLLAAAAFAFFFCLPLMAGSSQVLWQRTVPAELQGRVFSVRAAVAMSAVPLASLVAGPLADRVCEPAMRAGGAFAEILGPLIGIGRGRGIALILVAAGALSVIAAIVAGLYGPLRRLDEAAAVAPAPAPAGATG